LLKANSQEAYPIISEIVTDKANLFSGEELAQLTQKLTEYETKTTHQIVVLSIDALGNDTVENYAFQTFNLEGNQFGQAADNGILILIAKNDRKFRIEVGDGLTPIITDLYASRINRNSITPAFKKEEYYRGIDEATTEIIKLIDSPEYREEFSNLIEKEGKMPAWGIILLGLFITVFLGFFIFMGTKVVLEGYKRLINLYIGLITGKVSVLLFPLLFLVSIISVLFGLPFILAPIFFGIVIVSTFNNSKTELQVFDFFDKAEYLNINNGIIALVILLVVIPLIIAYFTRSKKRFTPINFSFTKSDKRFMSKNFSSGGISSGSTSSFSSGSSSRSFSGGGGSSSGGGSSGSW
jgi:uncharacterized protein